MIPRELIKKIKRIQIRTMHRVDELFSGSWHSAFKGRGIEFEEVRPYQPGDDVRAIDWNVTARSGEPFVKLFREERELAVWLLVDLSPSQSFGTQLQSKRELIAELSATVALSAVKNNDKVGLMLFSDQIEKHIPPRQGATHVLRIIREMLFCEPVGSGTNIRLGLERLMRSRQRRSIVFLISDFQDQYYEKTLRIVARKHDLIPVVVRDEREDEMANVGLIRLRDNETGQVVTVDTSSRRNRDLFRQWVRRQREEMNSLFRRLKISPLEIHTGQDFSEPLRRYFHQRELQR